MLAHTPLITILSPWFIVAAAAIALAWINKRGITGDALAYLEKANELLHKENVELKKERLTLIAQVEALKTKTDFNASLRPLVAWMNEHEANAVRRHDRIVLLLELIARTFGAEIEDDDATGH